METAHHLRRRTLLTALLGSSAAATVMSACSSGPGDGAQQAPPVRIHANDVPTYVQNFNPFSSTALAGATGLIYEPLMLTTSMDVENPVPWIAEDITFDEDGTGAEITVRQGITFHDGEPLTVDDVLYSLLLLRDEPATNGSALPVTDAATTGENTVHVSFDGPSFAYAPTLRAVYIMPKHIFEKIDVVNDTITEPIGSGPYTFGTFNSQVYTFVKNPDHWAADEFDVEELQWPAHSTETFSTALAQGELDWSGGFVANVEDLFVKADPEHRGYYYPGLGAVNLTFNLEKERWQNLELRRGISLAIDRKAIAERAMQGYVPSPHPTALPRPTFDEYIAADFKDSEFTYDPDEAGRVLDEAGYPMGPDGVRVGPDGTALDFPLTIPSSFADWVSVTQILDENLQAIGVRFSPQGVALESWIETRNSGNFDVTLSIVSAGASPWFMYRSMLSSKHRSDSGTVLANYQRWYDDETDELLMRFTSTDDKAEQQECIDGLQRIVVEKLPALPIVVAPNWFNYNAENWTGFPSEENPYALGAPYSSIDRVLVLRELTRVTD